VASIAAAQAAVAAAAFVHQLLSGLPFPLILQGSATFALLICAVALMRFGTEPRALTLAALLLLLASAASQRFLLPFRDSALLAPLARGLYPDAFLPFVAWSFVRDFPRVFRFSWVDGFCRAVLMVSAIAGGALCAANLAMAWLAHAGASMRLAIFTRDGGVVYWRVVFALFASALVVMVARVRDAERSEQRRVALFLGGLAAGLLPLVAIVGLELTNATFDRWTSHPKVLPIVDAIIYASILSIPFTTTYSVLVRRVLSVRLVVRRTVRYALARQTLLVGTILPVVILARRAFVNRHLTIAELFRGPDAMLGLGLAAVSMSLLFARERVLRFLNRRYFREEIDIPQSITSLADQLAEARDLRDIAELVEAAMVRTLQCDRAVLYRQHDDKFMAVRDSGSSLTRGCALEALLDASAEPLELHESALANLLPEADRSWMVHNAFAAIAPVTHAGRLLGFIAAGRRRNDLPFSTDASGFLSAAAASAALAIHGVVQTRTGGEAFISESPPAAECEVCAIVADPDAIRCECGGGLRTAALPVVLSGKFHVIRRLGSGGMGVVYLASDLDLGRQVALKTLPRLTSGAIDRLSREAQSMARVAHATLATIHGVEKWRGSPVLVIELLEGGTLAERLRHGPLPIDAAVSISFQLLDSLAHLHAHGFVHRDIKPGNIGFSSSNQLKLLDFGLAAALDESQQPTARTSKSQEQCLSGRLDSISGTIAGTPLYLPPEAFAGARPSAAFDLWAAAMVLYESIAGTHPLLRTKMTGALRRLEVPDVRSFRPDCPSRLAEFLRTALDDSEIRRPGTTAVFVNGLRGAV
jgi:hypothetical protein